MIPTHRGERRYELESKYPCLWERAYVEGRNGLHEPGFDLERGWRELHGETRLRGKTLCLWRLQLDCDCVLFELLLREHSTINPYDLVRDITRLDPGRKSFQVSIIVVEDGIGGKRYGSCSRRKHPQFRK